MAPGAGQVRRISMAPPSEPAYRQAGRLLAMVHELHKAGYQRIRISPGLARTGIHWRCMVTSADNVAPDGWSLLAFDVAGGRVAPYSTGQGDRYFDWPDAPGRSARELAVMFIQRFASIVERARGRDWPYAGWLTDVLGRAEQGTGADIPVFYTDEDLDNEWLRDWLPPPPPG